MLPIEVWSTPSTGPPKRMVWRPSIFDQDTYYINFRLQEVIFNGTQAFNFPPGAVGTDATIQRWGIDQDMHLVKIGVSYRFTSLVDVISARY